MTTLRLVVWRKFILPADIAGTVVRLRDRLRDPESIYHMAFVVLKTNAFVQGLLLFTSIMMIRHVSKADFGLWRVVASTMAMSQLFFVGFDHAIVRFVPVESTRNADSVVLSAFVMKVSLTLLYLILLLALYPHLPAMLSIETEMRPLFAGIFWLMVMSTAVSPVATTLFAVANAHKLFDLILRVSVAKQAAMLMCVVAIVSLDLGVAHYIGFELVLSIVQVIFMWRGISLPAKKGGDLWRAIRSANIVRLIRMGWGDYLRSYAMPLNLTSLVSYVRVHLPVIVIGGAFSLPDAAVYSILKNVLTTIHKAQGSIVEGVFPRVFELYETNRTAFVRKFYRYVTFTYLIRASIGVAILAGAPSIFWLAKIESTSYLKIVLAILVLEYLLTEIAAVSNLVVMMSRQTTMLLLSGVFRFILEAFLLVFVTMRFGILGAAVTLFLSRSAETISTVYFSNQILRLRRQYVLVVVLMVLFVFALIRANGT